MPKQIPLSEQMKQEALSHVNYKAKPKGNDVQTVLAGIGVILLVAFPVAYLFPILTIFTEFIFGTIEIFLGTNEPLGGLAEPIKDSFFYSEYWPRYGYCVSLMSVIWVWLDGLSKDEMIKIIQIIVTATFAIMAIMNINLLIGTIFGPPLIILGLLFTAKRR